MTKAFTCKKRKLGGEYVDAMYRVDDVKLAIENTQHTGHINLFVDGVDGPEVIKDLTVADVLKMVNGVDQPAKLSPVAVPPDPAIYEKGMYFSHNSDLYVVHNVLPSGAIDAVMLSDATKMLRFSLAEQHTFALCMSVPAYPRSVKKGDYLVTSSAHNVYLVTGVDENDRVELTFIYTSHPTASNLVGEKLKKVNLDNVSMETVIRVSMP